MSLIDHLEELRSRLLWAIASLFLAFLPCYYWVDEIFAFLQRPILRLLPPGKKLAYTGVTDPFFLYFKVAALAAVFAASPFILYQFWRFIAPGLYRHERRYLLPFLFFGSFFFLAGGAFAYYVAFPLAAEFLLQMGKAFEPVITIERYFGFQMTIILGLGLMFELPIVIFILFPVMIWTGLAMSPSLVAAFPFFVDSVGGHQSARTIHFFVTLALVAFLFVHIAMICLAGFRRLMRGMITGEAGNSGEVS